MNIAVDNCLHSPLAHVSFESLGLLDHSWDCLVSFKVSCIISNCLYCFICAVTESVIFKKALMYLCPYAGAVLIPGFICSGFTTMCSGLVCHSTASGAPWRNLRSDPFQGLHLFCRGASQPSFLFAGIYLLRVSLASLKPFSLPHLILLLIISNSPKVA